MERTAVDTFLTGKRQCCFLLTCAVVVLSIRESLHRCSSAFGMLENVFACGAIHLLSSGFFRFNEADVKWRCNVLIQCNRSSASLLIIYHRAQVHWLSSPAQVLIYKPRYRNQRCFTIRINEDKWFCVENDNIFCCCC